MATSEVTPIVRDVNVERGNIQKNFDQRGGFKSEIDRDLLQKISEIKQDMLQQGVYPALIANFNPFPLRAQGPLLDGYVVPACEPPNDAAYMIIDTYKIDIIDKGGRRDARAILPIVLARDFVRQQAEFGRGGIVCYGGSGDRIQGDYLGNLLPSDKRLPSREKELLKAAQKEMFVKCEQLVQEAQQEWSRPNGVGKMNVDDRHRKAFQVLDKYKLWRGKEPEWAVLTRQHDEVQEPCPRCGAEPAKGAMQCKVCLEWINPLKAYDEGYLDPEEPGGKLALSRCTKEELEERGLYDTIKPISERRAKKPAPRGTNKQ